MLTKTLKGKLKIELSSLITQNVKGRPRITSD